MSPLPDSPRAVFLLIYLAAPESFNSNDLKKSMRLLRTFHWILRVTVIRD